jgi:transposase
MRKGISFIVTASDRRYLNAIVADRSAPQKHVWRARVVLLSGDGHGTTAIMIATGKSKTCVWRWQERFMREGVAGLLRDKTRPSRIPPLAKDRVDEVIALTLKPPPHEASHWTVRAMAKVVGLSASTVHEIRCPAAHVYMCERGEVARVKPASLAAVQTVK